MAELYAHALGAVKCELNKFELNKSEVNKTYDPFGRRAEKTPHLYHNLEDHWLTPRLVQMGLDQEGMGWHSFKRFRKTWLRGARCLEDINNFWMAHKPKTMSEVYSHLHEELEMRLAEAERVGYGFTIPKIVVPSVPRFSGPRSTKIAA